MNCLVVGLLVIFGCGSTSNHASAQSLNFSLQSRNSYICSEYVATFLCSGVGNELIFYAPPLVNLSSPIRYLEGEALGTGVFRDPFAANLISTTDSKMIAQLTVQSDIAVEEIAVRCIVRSPSEEGIVLYRREGDIQEVSSPVVTQTDGPNDFDLGTVEVSWIGTSGDFNISHYTIQFLVNGIVASGINVSPDILSTEFSAPHGSTVRARITVNSACGRSTTGVMTDVITVSKSTSICVAIAFFVILAIAVVALGVAVVVLSGLLCCSTK